MLHPLGKEDPTTDKIAHSTFLELGLDKVVAMGLKNGLVGFGGVHDQHLFVSDVEVADEGRPGPCVGPVDLQLHGGRGFEYGQELPDEGEVILVVWCQLFAHSVSN